MQKEREMYLNVMSNQEVVTDACKIKINVNL